MKPGRLSAFCSLLVIFPFIRPRSAAAVDEHPCFAESPGAGSLRNVAYDRTKNVIYVAAVDAIYRLSSDLKSLNSRRTGPICSTGAARPCADCSDSRNVCPQNGEPVSSFNQLLLVNPAAARSLIACGNLYNGSCNSLGLDDLTPSAAHEPAISVVPDNATLSSAVGFVGRGRGGDGSVLYVGASYAPASGNRSYDVPLISVRNLSSFQPLGSAIDLNADRVLRDTFAIDFVAALEHNKFVYFFVRRRRGMPSSGEFGTFLLRICKDQPTKTSLVELPLKCGTGFSHLRDATVAPNGAGGDAFYAVFTADSSSTGARNSTLCIYPVGSVDEAFRGAIQNCFNGTGRKGPSYATEDTGTCIQRNKVIEVDYCGEVDYNSPIAGDVSVLAQSSFSLPVNVATTLSAAVVNGAVVLFVGSNNGQILKATFSGSKAEQPYFDWVEIPDKALRRPITEIVAGAAADSLYLLTDKYLCRVPAYDCSRAHSCDRCVKDPHCGWCMRSRSCTHKDLCAPLDGMNIWLNRLEQCPAVEEVVPTMLSVNLFEQTSILVGVRYIPETVRNASCSLVSTKGYKGSPLPARVERSNDGKGRISCSPPPSLPPSQMTGLTSINLTLAVALNGLPWFEASTMVFDCSQLKSCVECLEPVFPCNWCSKSQLCRHPSQLGDCSAADSEYMYVLNSSSSCPRVERANGTGSPLVTGSGQDATFRFVVFNVMPFHETSGLRCRFGSGPGSFRYSDAVLQPKQSDAQHHSRRTVNCSSVKLTFSADVASELVPFDLTWGGSGSEFALDNPSRLQIEVFKCRFKAANCGRCLLLDAGYGCVWCMDSCRHPSDCSYPAFLQRDAMCPNPKITSFSPRGGPVGGRTVLTINGINLGKAASDLTIRVADRPCEVMHDDYLPTERVLCRTGSAGASSNGTIYLSVRGVINSTESEQAFLYKDPNVIQITPRKGPMSGGTRVTAVGTELDYGSRVEMVVAEGPPRTEASILWRNATQLVFAMPSNVQPHSVSLKFLVDQNLVPLKMYNYVYYEDPAVTSVNPDLALLIGGNLLDVRGTNLNTISLPQFVVYVGDRNFTTNCRTATSASFMQCPTPDLRDVDLSGESHLSCDYGFIMDDVRQLLRIQTENPSIGRIRYVASPTITKFKSPVAYAVNTNLIIKGENLKIFDKFTDFSISINGSKCTSAEFKQTEMSCEPPKAPADPKHLDENGDAPVVVYLGNFVFEVGYLSYFDYGMTTAHVVAIACGVAVALVVALVVAVVCLRRAVKRRSKSPLLPRMRDASQRDRTGNSYVRTTEMEPLQRRENEGQDQASYEDPGRDDDRFIQNLLRKIENPRRRNAAKEILVARDRLDMGTIIGRGHFSCVYTATLKDAAMRNPVQVAAKTIEGSVFDEKTLETILRESVVMSNFNHARLVSLTGLCLSSRTNPVVILPFMPNGNLKTYIKDKTKNFTARQLLLMSQQVAEGMSYLSSCYLVHRNLAARNCLLDENFEVKVSDFVLCHELFEHALQYGSPDDWVKLPIKWMAPETLEGFVFTSASDVWSFGVLMWELMTRGIAPYSEIPLSEMKVFLNSEQRLKKPKYCPETVYRIMVDCWQKVAERRPTFPDLVNRLEVLLNPPRKRQPSSIAADEEPLYVNTTDPSIPNYLRPAAPSPSP